MSNLQHEAFLNRQKGPSAMSDGLIPTPGLAKDQPKDTDAKVDYIAPAPTPAPAPRDVATEVDLDAMTVSELKDLAEQTGVDITHASRKSDIIDALRDA